MSRVNDPTGRAGWWSRARRLMRRTDTRARGTDVRIGVSTLDPEAEVRALRSLAERMVEIQGPMMASVTDLRDDLAQARGLEVTARPRPYPPATLPGTSADVIGEAVSLALSVESLQEQLDALWFERQWLAAQIAVANGEVILPRRRD